MKLLALNIYQGGGTSIAAIADHLVAQDCDAVVISEYKQNTVMAASKMPRTPIAIPGCINDWSLAGVAWAGIQLVSGYLPQRKIKPAHSTH